MAPKGETLHSQVVLNPVEDSVRSPSHIDALDLTVSIVAYKTRLSLLKNAINCVIQSNLKVQIHLIDHSPNDTINEGLKDYPQIVYSHNPENPGYGAGHNSSIRTYFKMAPIHLILNPDVTFEAHVLPTLHERLLSDPTIGLIAPRIIFPNGDPQQACKLLPTPIDVFMRRFAPTLKWTHNNDLKYELHGLRSDRIYNIPNLSGCFMMVKASVVEEIGGFDEHFFMYFEDIDLCRRIHKYYQTQFYPFVSIEHDCAKASYHDFRLLLAHIRSAILYFNKWGWLFDSDRKSFNQAAYRQIKNE